MPRAALGFLMSRSARGLVSAHRDLGLFAAHPHLRLISPRRLAAARRLGLEIYVWPVNAAPALGRLRRLGVDGVMTDDPALFDAA